MLKDDFNITFTLLVELTSFFHRILDRNVAKIA